MTQAKQTFTFLSRTAPYGSSRPQLCLDAALATAVFEQHVNYVLIDDGVYQLLKNQNAESIQSRTISNAIETLELYGIDKIFVDAESLKKRQLDRDDLLIPIEQLSSKEISELLHKSDHIITL